MNTRWWLVLVAALAGCSSTTVGPLRSSRSTNAAVEVAASSLGSVPDTAAVPSAPTVPVTVPLAPAVAEVMPRVAAGTRGLSSVSGDVASTVHAFWEGLAGVSRASGADGCRAFTDVLEQSRVRLSDMLSGDDTVDRELLELMGELQLSISIAAGECAAGSPGANRAVEEVRAVAGLVLDRDRMLGS